MFRSQEGIIGTEFLLLHRRPAFNFWKTKGAEKLYSVVFPKTLKVTVAYRLAAAPSTDGWTFLPFCTSHTDG